MSSEPNSDPNLNHSKATVGLEYIEDENQSGLNLKICSGANGVERHWVFLYSSPINGERGEIDFGSISIRGLDRARELAAAFTKITNEGYDPKFPNRPAWAPPPRVRRNLFRAPIFEEVACAYLNAHQHEWKNDEERQIFCSPLEIYAYPILGQLPVDQIGVDQVLKVLEPIWIDNMEVAKTVRDRISGVMRYASGRVLYAGYDPTDFFRYDIGSQLLPKA